MTFDSNISVSDESAVSPAEAPLDALRSRIVSGSLLLLAGSGLVGVTNLLYNIAIARMLGPTGFGHATAVYTVLMLMSAVTLSFQIVCTKLVANHDSPAEKAAVYVGLHRRAWRFGIAIGLLMVLARGLVASYLNLPSTTLVILLALGTTFYVPLGARRGCIQGTYAFNLLAINLMLEGVVRLGGAVLLIHLGMGVNGAVLASVAAIVVAYLFAAPGRGLVFDSRIRIDASFREGLQAIVFFVGQVIINNFDIILVKHFFTSSEAGLYAAVALVGRFVNMCAWSVVNSMFPVSAGSRTRGGESKRVLITSLLLVSGLLALVVLGLWMVPEFLWNLTFGSQFAVAGARGISSLLILYAVTTGVYSLSAVIIAFEMSRKIANTGWVQLMFSGALILGIFFFHDTLRQVILVQLALMLMLLVVVVLLPFLRSGSFAGDLEPLDAFGLLHQRRRLREEEVISEFLKNEFHHPEFDQYRAKFEAMVSDSNPATTREDGLRRALLFLRRGAMWRELPPDTRWVEVDLDVQALERIRVFPRAQWRRIADGSFYLNDIVERIREELASPPPNDEFLDKLRLLSTLVRNNDLNSTVLLIGVDETGPLTILDGNHRVAAGMLVDPAVVVKQFRFLCGFSPRMTECCWYQTNVMTLWRYAKNLLRYMPYDPEQDINRFLQRS